VLGDRSLFGIWKHLRLAHVLESWGRSMNDERDRDLLGKGFGCIAVPKSTTRRALGPKRLLRNESILTATFHWLRSQESMQERHCRTRFIR